VVVLYTGITDVRTTVDRRLVISLQSLFVAVSLVTYFIMPAELKFLLGSR